LKEVLTKEKFYMSVELEVLDSAVHEVQKQYVCFVKRGTGGKFIPYTQTDSDVLVVKTLREFLDHEISRWYRAGESEKIESRLILRVSLDDFKMDLDLTGMNSKLAEKLGWNYAAAARFVESEGMVVLLTAHPRFPSIPFSFRRVCEEDEYALHFVKQILSVRGGEILFEEYDPDKHIPGYRYGD
jgi:hypothetical protein